MNCPNCKTKIYYKVVRFGNNYTCQCGINIHTDSKNQIKYIEKYVNQYIITWNDDCCLVVDRFDERPRIRYSVNTTELNTTRLPLLPYDIDEKRLKLFLLFS